MTQTIQKLHAEYKTPQSLIFKAVREATKQFPAKREKITRGYANEVYRVTTHEGGRYIVRIRRGGEVPFAQEQWAIDQAHHVGAPVPKVLQVTERIIDGMPRDVMVMEHLPGQPLSELLPSMSPIEKERVFTQAGAALAKIHKIPVGGFYRRHTGGSWDFYDWGAVMDSTWQDRSKEAVLLVNKGVLPQEDVALALFLIKKYRFDFPCAQPVLCHGDFHPEHLLVTEDGNLSGVIDFGEFQGGPPIHDIAYLSIEYPEVDLSWVKAGYGPALWWDDSFPRRLLLHKIILLLGYLAYYVQEGWTEEAEPIWTGLANSLQEWRCMSD